MLYGWKNAVGWKILVCGLGLNGKKTTQCRGSFSGRGLGGEVAVIRHGLGGEVRVKCIWHFVKSGTKVLRKRVDS